MKRSKTLAAAVALSVPAALIGLHGLTGAGADTPDGEPRPQPSASLEGLKVLLANDDSARGRETRFGTDGRGLYELRSALCDAGADVVVVAPWSQQSGAGGRITTPSSRPVPVTVTPVTPPAAYADDCGDAGASGPVYGVCVDSGPCTDASPSGSPADAVTIGLSRLVPDHYWADGPDVVLSGINFGQNVGALVNHSGTVGAAVTAHELGYPALAFSAEVSFADLSATPFEGAADFAVETLRRLVAADRLDSDTALNVNYPFVEAGDRLGRPTYAVIGHATDIGSDYSGDVPVTGGTYELLVGPPTDETRRDSDTTALRENRIPITPLDGDWSDAGGRSWTGFVNRW